MKKLLLTLLVIPILAWAHGDLRTYNSTTGQNSTLYFAFVDPDDTAADYLQSTPTISAGDCRISLDGGAWSNCDNLPAWESEGIGSIVLTAAEMQASIILVKIRDQSSTQEWVTTTIEVHTGGASGALHYTP